MSAMMSVCSHVVLCLLGAIMLLYLQGKLEPHASHTIYKPANWFPQEKNYLAVDIAPDSNEFETVKQNFELTIGEKTASIVKIQRIQNWSQYQQFIIERNRVAEEMKKSPDNVVRCFLWHGTSNDNVEKICKTRFDRSLCGENGVVCGQGSYFSIMASKSHKYSKMKQKKSSDMLKLIASCVVVGEYTEGDESMKVPPYKTGSHRYHTTVDNKTNPKIFVAYSDAGVYPEYVISYKT